MTDLSDLRVRVCKANLDLVAHGLVLCTWGNVSGIARETGRVVIKPSGIAYSALTPDCMVVTDLDGRVLEGDLRPSSDLDTHLEIYRAFGGVGGVAHTHSRAATSFAQAKRALPCYGTTHADHFYGTIPVTRDMSAAETSVAYEANTGLVLVEAIGDRDPLEISAVLVASHGPFTWGDTPETAVINSVVLEAVAEMALQTLSLAPVPPIGQHLLDRHFLRKHGATAYYGQVH